MLSRRIVQSRTSNLDLDVPGCLGNVDRLDTHLTIDDVRFAPCAFLVAGDINPATGAWASRHDATKTLSVAGSGAAPTYGNVTAIENLSAIYTVSNKYHTAANTTWAQLSDKDFAIEIVYVHDPYLENLPFKTWNGTRGYALYNNGANQTTFYFNDGSSSVQSLVNVVPVTGAIYHLLILGDRSENLYGYLNGVFSDTRALTGVSGNLSTGSGVLLIGSGSSQIISFGVWDLPTNPFPGALKNRTYFDKIARERFAIVAGIQDRRQGAHTFTRATLAYLDKYETPTSTARWLYKVPAGWPRICQRKDANGKVVVRPLCEKQATNLATNSEDLATTWTAENLTTIAANGQVAANGTTTADGIVANATDTTHGIYGAYTLPATNHCLSAFVEYGNKGWVELYSSITNVSCYFDISNGVVGTAGAAVTAAGVDAQSYKGVSGIYRVWICFTGSADAKNYGVRTAQADGDNTFAGDTTTANTWVWGIQIEATAELFPSSYIPTAAAAVVRNKDELSYSVRLPIVRNIDDLPQALTIGGTDYDPCAYLVSGDCQADGTWLSRSTYHANILIDGAMEAADTSYWASGNSATLSKEAGTPHGGSLCLRCARNGTNHPYFVKTGTTIIGKTYRLRGYVRSDGTAIPIIYDSGAVLLFTGTTSTSWQAFDITYVAVGLAPYFWVSTSSGTTYCEWDDITLESEAKLAFVGAGTNPTPQWNAVSKANKTIRYWGSNYHAAADTTWGQIGDNDGVVEALFVSMDGSTISTRASGSLLGYGLGVSSGATSFIVGDGTDYVSVTASPVHAVGTLVHFMAFIDKSDKVYFVVNGVYFGVSASTASIGNSTGGTLSFGALSGGVSAVAGQLALFAAWNLPTNPLPGAATNEAVCTAIARARFDQLCQPTAMRLDCEILHPNVNRQTKVSLVDLSINQIDYNSLMLDTDDYGLAQAGYNNTWAWNSSTTKGSTDICDNVSRKLSIAARENNARYKEDNATIASDTSCEIPTTYSVVRVGMWADNNFQPTCLVGGVKLWRSDK